MSRLTSRIAFALLVLVAAMGMNACPNTMNMNMNGNANDNANGNMSGSTMSAEEMQLSADALAAINAHRAGKGLAALTAFDAGAQVAFEHCLAMQAGNFFDHVNPNTGTDPATRAKNAGITHDPQGSIDPTSGNPFVGENLYTAFNAGLTGQDAVDSWIGSPGHHTQIDAPLPVAGAQTMPPWTHCGIGVRRSGNTVWYCAMFFRNPS